MREGDWRLILVSAVVIAVLLAGIVGPVLFGPLSTPPDITDSPTTIPDTADTIEAVHAANITGEGVTVGVVDVTSFDTDHPAIADNVVTARSFAPGRAVSNGGQASHGTAVASTVTRVAPDSSLYLATFNTVDGFQRSVNWLLQSNVDVIVVPVTFYGQFDARESAVRATTERATAQGVPVVASVGNLGRGHWEGQYQPVDDGVHRFAGGTRNYLQETNSAGLRLWLSWNQSHRDEDYTAELYWTNGTASRLVARSRPYPGDDVPNERIITRLRNGSYYIQVTGPPNATGTHLKLESPTHNLEYRSRSGSVTAPVTAPEVIAVGAYDRTTRRVRPFSSAGPTRDGHVGVDLVAPDGYPAATKPDGFVGSSASAPYVAGVVALALEADSDQSPEVLESVLERTATDLRQPGPDPVSGHGLIQPAEAVRFVQDRADRTGANHSNPG